MSCIRVKKRKTVKKTTIKELCGTKYLMYPLMFIQLRIPQKTIAGNNLKCIDRYKRVRKFLKGYIEHIGEWYGVKI